MAKKPIPDSLSRKHQARIEREKVQKRNLLIGGIFAILLIAGIIGYSVLDQAVLKPNRPVAKVGNDTITTQKFETRVKYTRSQLIQRYRSTAQLMQYFGSDPSSASYFQGTLQQIQSQLDDATTLGQTVLGQLIDEVVTKQEAAQMGISVSTADVDQAMQAAFGYYPDGTPIPSTTPTMGATSTLSATQLALVTPTLTATPGGNLDTATPTNSGPTPTLAPQPTGTPYTLEGYQGEVKSFLDSVKDLGVAEADLRDLVEANLYRDKVRAKVTEGTPAEEEEVWARHILVADEATANQVLQDLQSGKSWDDLVQQYSTDTSSKDAGGDLGWFARGVMVTEFENAAFALKVGETSQPVQTSFGWHVIQVLGHEMRPLDASQYSQLLDQKFQEWLTTTEASLDIQKYNSTWQANVPVEPTLDPSERLSQSQ